MSVRSEARAIVRERAYRIAQELVSRRQLVRMFSDAEEVRPRTVHVELRPNITINVPPIVVPETVVNLPAMSPRVEVAPAVVNIPAPVVHISPAQVNVSAPEVYPEIHVTVPPIPATVVNLTERAMPAPSIVVNVPTQPAPVVNVAATPAARPNIVVNVPPIVVPPMPVPMVAPEQKKPARVVKLKYNSSGDIVEGIIEDKS